MDKKPKKKTEPKPAGISYVCISAHDDPYTRPDKSQGFKAITVGAVATFEKNPGPCWRLEKIKKTEEVD